VSVLDVGLLGIHTCVPWPWARHACLLPYLAPPALRAGLPFPLIGVGFQATRERLAPFKPQNVKVTILAPHRSPTRAEPSVSPPLVTGDAIEFRGDVDSTPSGYPGIADAPMVATPTGRYQPQLCLGILAGSDSRQKLACTSPEPFFDPLHPPMSWWYAIHRLWLAPNSLAMLSSSGPV